MRNGTLAAWLRWLEGLHPRAIDLGLERVGAVARRLGLYPAPVPVVTVAGTNGKGSVVACLEACYRAAGRRPGGYTSPHLLAYNERIRIAGEPAADAAIVAAFEAIDAARGEISLTYFEFATLAAAWCFRDAGCDLWILEVGLGGRLDATNVFDADVAVITSIDLDHMEWLGPDREAIAREKLGIARRGRPVVCGDPDPPASLVDGAAALGAPLLARGDAFRLRVEAGAWHWEGEGERVPGLPRLAWMPDVALGNAAAAVAVMRLADPRLALTPTTIRAGLTAARLPGRLQQLPAGDGHWLLDVAHNPAAVTLLVQAVAERRGQGRVRAAFGLMRRKRLETLVALLVPVVDEWFALEIDDEGWSAAEISAAVRAEGGRVIGEGDAAAAVRTLEPLTGAGDLALGVGSFRVVEALLRAGAGAPAGAPFRV